MSNTLQISLTPDLYRPVVFPNRCVCCGATREAESTLALNRFVKRGERQEAVTLKYQVPHCRRCARSTKTVFLAGCIPFVLGLLEAYWDAYEAVGLNVFAGGYEYLEEVWQYHQRMVEAICKNDFEAGYEALVKHTDLLYHRA